MTPFKKCAYRVEIEAVQFNYIDGIDGPETRKFGSSIGLSQNVPRSALWEIQTFHGWKIVNSGDWIVVKKNIGFQGEDVVYVMTGEEFNREFKIVGEEAVPCPPTTK